MKETIQNVIVAIVAGLIAGVVVLHFAPKTQVVNSFGSTAGTTFLNAKSAGIVWAPTSNTASSTSIQNTDASDRIIKQIEWSCTGANFTAANSLANVIFSAATTSVSSLGLQGNTNLALFNTVSSSTAEVYTATSTQATTGRRWNAGSWLTFDTNATSTGESCVISADYLAT